VASALATHSCLTSTGGRSIPAAIRSLGPLEVPANQKNRKLPGHYLPNPHRPVAGSPSQREYFRFADVCVTALYAAQTGARSLVDGSTGSLALAPTLIEIFPSAVFVIVLRDGRDVMSDILAPTALRGTRRTMMPMAWSSVTRIVRGERWSLRPSPLSFQKACQDWRQHTLRVTTLAREMPDRCFTVRYHELAAGPEDGFRQIFAFLHVPFESAPAEHFRSAVHGPAPVAAEAMPRKERWTLWTAEEGRIFREEAGDAMVSCGFLSPSELA
jgi:hypothetical protein